MKVTQLIFITFAVLAFVRPAFADEEEEEEDTSDPYAEPNSEEAKWETKRGVQIQAYEVPEHCEDFDATKTKSGDKLKMHYTGSLESFEGQVFDSSRAEGRDPIDFVLGKGQVIKGWDIGLTKMCVGEKRKLIIPPNRGYGDKGVGESIPPGATLYFDVELVDIEEKDEQADEEKTEEAKRKDLLKKMVPGQTILDSPTFTFFSMGAFALLFGAALYGAQKLGEEENKEATKKRTSSKSKRINSNRKRQ